MEIHLVYHLIQIVVLLKSQPGSLPRASQHTPNVDYLFIASDVETTSLEDDCDLVQLSAVLTTSHFDAYVIPRKQITSASRVTDLTVVGSQLLLHRKPVSTVDIQAGLRNFTA